MVTLFGKKIKGEKSKNQDFLKKIYSLIFFTLVIPLQSSVFKVHLSTEIGHKTKKIDIKETLIHSAYP